MVRGWENTEDEVELQYYSPEPRVVVHYRGATATNFSTLSAFFSDVVGTFSTPAGNIRCSLSFSSH